MTVKQFFEMSTGEWKCLRSSHNIAFGMVEEVSGRSIQKSHHLGNIRHPAFIPAIMLPVTDHPLAPDLFSSQTNTDMVIEDIPMDDPVVVEMCKNNNADISKCIIASK